MQAQAGDVRTHGVSTLVGREVEEVLRHRMWIEPEQVRVRVEDGAASLTGAVGRRSTADIAARLAGEVPGVTDVIDRIRYDFDDTDLIHSKVNRTHPFSADPFPPDWRRRRITTRLSGRSRRGPGRSAS